MRPPFVLDADFHLVAECRGTRGAAGRKGRAGDGSSTAESIVHGPFSVFFFCGAVATLSSDAAPIDWPIAEGVEIEGRFDREERAKTMGEEREEVRDVLKL